MSTLDLSPENAEAPNGITKEQELDARIAYLQCELAGAQAQRRALEAKGNGCTDIVGPISESQVQDDEDEDDEDGPPEPIWDDRDCCYRCVACSGEVVEGECQFCAAEHVEVDDLLDDKYTSEPLLPTFYTIERGLTPPAEHVQHIPVPPTFPGSDDAYRALLLHGATPAMVELFRLEWNEQTGITAWATEPLYDAWAGPAITSRRGQAWKIVLGRRVELDADDVDGARWVRELLDECLDPMGYAFRYWETVEERAGVWVTRRKPVIEGEDEDGDGDDEMDVSQAADDAEGDDEDAEGDDEDDDEDEDSEEELPQDLDPDGPIKYWDAYEDDSGIDDDEDLEWKALIRSGLAHDSDNSDSEGVGLLSDDDGGNYSTTLMSDEDKKRTNRSDRMDCDRNSDWDSETSDSDKPGSDWDSQEELSGDEMDLRHVLRVTQPVGPAPPQPTPGLYLALHRGYF